MATNIKLNISATVNDASIKSMKQKIESNLKPKIELDFNLDKLKSSMTQITSMLNDSFKDLATIFNAKVSENNGIVKTEQKTLELLEKQKRKQQEILDIKRKQQTDYYERLASDAASRAKGSIQIGENKLTVASEKIQNPIAEGFANKINEAKTQLAAYNQEITTLKEAFAKGKISQSEYIDGLSENITKVKELRANQLSTNREIAQAEKTHKSFGKTLLANAKQFATWISSTRMVMAVISIAKKAIQTVIELDKAFTNIRMVTGYTSDQMKQLKQDYTELAQTLKVTTKEVADAATEWLRQGLSMEETTTALTASIKFAKVASISTTEATKLLTSAMKGYGLTVQSLIGISDRLNKVDMASATSAADLAKAMSETAASAKAAGIQMDTLIGYLATMQEVTQDSAESVGNSMKTILARMSQVAAGVDVDEYGESLNNVEKVLTKYGISLRDTYGNMRNMEVVLDEVAKRWNKLSNTQRNQIATAIAGTRQAEKFRVLMMNYSRAIDLATESLESNGTTLNKYGLYLESIEAATNRVTASFEKLSTELIDSSAITGILDALTGIMELLSTGGVIEGAGTIIKGIVDIIKGLENLGSFLSGDIFHIDKDSFWAPLFYPDEFLKRLGGLFSEIGGFFTHLFGGKTKKEIEETKNRINELGDAYDQFKTLASQTELSEVQSKTLEKLKKDMEENSAAYRKMLADGEDATYAYYKANLMLRASLSKDINEKTYLSDAGIQNALASLDAFYNKWNQLDSNAQKERLTDFKKLIENVKKASASEEYQQWAKDYLDSYLDAYEKIVEYDPIDYQISQIKKKLEEEKKVWEEEQEALEKKKQLEEKILAVQQAQEKLAQAKNKRARVYRAGRGFVYEQDFSAVSSAEKELRKTQEELVKYQKEIYYENAISELEKLQDAEQSFWRDSSTGLQDWYNENKTKYKMNAENYAQMIEEIRQLTNEANIDLGNSALGAILNNITSISTPMLSNSAGTSNVVSYSNSIPNVASQVLNSSSGNTINIGNITLPNVTDSESFVNELNSIGRISAQMGASHK